MFDTLPSVHAFIWAGINSSVNYTRRSHKTPNSNEIYISQRGQAVKSKIGAFAAKRAGRFCAAAGPWVWAPGTCLAGADGRRLALYYTRAPTPRQFGAAAQTLLIIITIIISVVVLFVIYSEKEACSIYLPFLQMKSPGEKSTGRRRSTSSHKKPASVFWKISTRFKVSRCTLMAISAFSLSEKKRAQFITN